ncbi:hypothetical protein ACCS93_33515 [Rhizobium ruizarguesonis]
MRAPEIRPVRDSYRIDTASKTGILSFIDRCTKRPGHRILNMAVGSHNLASATLAVLEEGTGQMTAQRMASVRSSKRSPPKN